MLPIAILVSVIILIAKTKLTPAQSNCRKGGFLWARSLSISPPWRGRNMKQLLTHICILEAESHGRLQNWH